MARETRILLSGIGAVAKRARLERGLRVREVIESIGMSEEFYYRLERCECIPPMHVLVDLSRALSISTDELLGLVPYGDDDHDDDDDHDNDSDEVPNPPGDQQDP